MPFIRLVEKPTLRNPWAEFERIRRGLDELSQNYNNRYQAQNKTNVFPALNIYEEADKLVVTAELPGVIADDLDLTLEGETLTIKGTRKQQHNEKISYHRREIETGTFSRSVRLPVKIDVHNLSAQLTDGILSITLSKATHATPTKITVQAE